MAERVILFPCAGETLIGILAMPEVSRDVGVIILVGGPQYRVGGHRQNVQLARRLSEAGYVTLRFDYRGTGDSRDKLLN
jgi:alpha/beta superfamily hydrolase